MRMIARFFAFLFGTATLIGLIGAAVVGYVVWHYSQDLPDHAQLAKYEPPVTTRIHAADGSLLAEYARERRLYLPIQAMPKLLIAAYLSAEDKNFYKHGGVDPEGIARAVVRGRAAGGRQQGASTITQQVAKNFFLSPEQTFDRKIKEALLAFRLEATFSKDKILELYLNQIYLGFGNYGVAAAALNYYGKSVHELTIAEAAYLAALPKAPSTYHPINNRDAAIGRRNYVIDRMIDNGYITKEDGVTARAEPLVVTFRQLSPNSYAAGFFAEEVRRDLAERYGSKKLYEGGLSVRSTLDPKLQIFARKALSDGLVRYDESKGWRGATEKIPPTGDWGLQLAELPTLTDVDPWRLAVVLSVDETQAQIGLQPAKLGGGTIDRKRQTGVITTDSAKIFPRKRLREALTAGDVIYVEPIADKEGQFRLRQVPEISGAIVAMDPHTGRVKAMVGGFSFDKSEFNRATQALRQVGSAFKPIVYAAALDNGYTPSSIVLDEPIEVDQGAGQEVWRPSNYDGKSTGPHTLRYGIERSKNLMTVRLARDLGMPLVAEYAKRFGVYDDMLPVLAMSLGAGETTVLRMTAAYSMLANGGRRIRPTLIDRIQDRWGATIYKHDERVCSECSAIGWSSQDEPKVLDKRERVIDPMSAYQMVSIMEGVVQRGTATILKSLGRPLAGKTGTTNDAKDVWFVGFSPDLAVGVYLGYDKPRSLGARAAGGVYAAPIFKDFMKEALAGKPILSFQAPAGIKFIRVNLASGQRDSGGTLEPFKPNTAPPESYSFGTAAAGGSTGGGSIITVPGGLY